MLDTGTRSTIGTLILAPQRSQQNISHTSITCWFALTRNLFVQTKPLRLRHLTHLPYALVAMGPTSAWPLGCC